MMVENPFLALGNLKNLAPYNFPKFDPTKTMGLENWLREREETRLLMGWDDQTTMWMMLGNVAEAVRDYLRDCPPPTVATTTQVSHTLRVRCGTTYQQDLAQIQFLQNLWIDWWVSGIKSGMKRVKALEQGRLRMPS